MPSFIPYTGLPGADADAGSARMETVAAQRDQHVGLSCGAWEPWMAVNACSAACASSVGLASNASRGMLMA